MKPLTCASLTLIAGAPALLGQSTTTSALVGEVCNAKGKPVAGATLELRSDALIGGARKVATAENGTYRAPVLPPGEYRVVIQASGYSPATRRVRLALGATVPMNVVLEDLASATVEVVASSVRTVGAAPEGTSPSFTSEQLESLPMKRDLTSVMNLTPGVNANPGALGPTAWGGDRSNSNAYMIDGINVGDPVTGNQYVYVNPDWFQEIQVGGLGAPAEFGGFNGAYVNSLIKSGGNSLEGRLSAYLSPDSWRSRPKLMDPRLVDTSLPTKDWESSINIGGPILKDRLWYFVSAQRVYNSQAPIGALEPRVFNNPKLLGKIKWQVAANTTLDTFLGYDGVFREHRGITSSMEPVASIKQAGADRSFGATLTHLLGASAVFTLRGTGYHGRYQLREYQPGIPAISFSSGSYRGLTLFRNATASDSYLSTRGTLSAVLDVFANALLSSSDSHAFRIGLEREQAVGEQLSVKPGGLVYTATYNAATGRPRTNYVLKGGDLNLKGVLDRTVVYVQDVWTVGRWRLEPGFRFEKFEGRGYGTGPIWSTNTLAPRLGGTYDLKGDQKHLLKLHWGRYYDGLALAYFDRAVPGAYSVSSQYYWGTGATFAPTDFDITNPEAVPYSPTPYRTATDTNNSKLDPGVKHPYTEESLLAFESQLSPAWTAAFTWVHRTSKDLLGRFDRNLTGAWTDRVYDPVADTTIPVFDPTNTVQDYVIANNPLFHRTYRLLSASLDRRFKDNWSFNASYTRAIRSGNTNRSNGYDDASVNPNYQVNFDGKLPGFHDNEIKARGVLRLPWNMDLSASFTYLSGEHFTRVVKAATTPIGRIAPGIFAEPLGSGSFPSRRLLDLHLSQRVGLSKQVQAELFADVFNLLNTGTPTAWTSTTSNNISARNATDSGAKVIYSQYLKPSTQEDARYVRLGFRLKF